MRILVALLLFAFTSSQKAPHFEEYYSTIKVRPNQMVILSCKSGGLQPIAYVWRRDINGVFIKLDVFGELLSLSEVANLNTIEDLFTCSAINDYGSVLKYFKVLYNKNGTNS